MLGKIKLICLTPVRNEAWILKTFLEATLLWADYIIIADQNSTDGSREIAQSFPKVILIDNPDPDLHETNRQRLLFGAARQIEGPKVFIALDADELFTSNFMETPDWKKIKHAQAGDVFQFRWATIEPDLKRYELSPDLFQWAIFDDGTNTPEREGYIHVARVPWPQNSAPQEIVISDFQVMHLQKLNQKRNVSKTTYYQCITRIEEPKMSAIRLYRQYHPLPPKDLIEIPDYFIKNYRSAGIDIFGQLKLDEPYFWQDIKVLEYFDTYGIRKFGTLDIYDTEWLQQMELLSGKRVEDPRTILEKLLHIYLKYSQKYNQSIFIRAVDRVLKSMV